MPAVVIQRHFDAVMNRRAAIISGSHFCLASALPNKRIVRFQGYQASMNSIEIRGARTHNLKNIDLTLPRDQLIVITGLSGSGKSSLAFDTIYAEGQRRYVESLSAYARQFLSMMEKPDVDSIEGLSPAISIEQKSTSHNPRSTVGTVTEIHDYLRLLFARVGQPFCPDHDHALEMQSVSQMVDRITAFEEGSAWMLLAPIVRGRKGEHILVIEDLRKQGFVRLRIDGVVYDMDSLPDINPKQKHDIEVVIDRFKIRDDLKQRLAESIETALGLADGVAMVAPWPEAQPEDVITFSARYACPTCGYSLSELEPRLFSFNSPTGACSSCDGLGSQAVFDADKVVGHPELSLAGGAIRGWDRKNPWCFSMIESLARHLAFDPEDPFIELDETVQEAVLYGTKNRIEFQYPRHGGGFRTKKHKFEGILSNLQRRYKETESEAVREELARYLTDKPCPACHGQRLNTAARHVFVGERNIPELCHLSIDEAQNWFSELQLEGNRQDIAERILKEINLRLSFLVNVGLDYLSLDRSAETLSGGEAQRIRLASQIGAGLVGVMYVLDEPSIGLHQRDNQRLLDTLFHLRDLGNTVIVVEHDEDAIRSADYVIDIGPGAGVHGGAVVAQGNFDAITQCQDSLTGDYLSSRKAIHIPKERQTADPKKILKIRGAAGNNLKKIDVQIPAGLMTCVTGVSGSGKSTLVNDTLYGHAARVLNRASTETAECDGIDGMEHFDKVIDIDQSPIGRTPRSNPATYTGLFTPIRELFAQVPESRSRGYKPGRFSFNVKGGRCEACQGDGLIKVEMHFLPDIYVPCDVCHGKRYNRETLEIKYKGQSIDRVLNMTVEEGLEFFDAIPVLKRKLQTLLDVGLSYIRLGQAATTLSGGEAQRIKLARELSKRDTGRTLYILDEPTTGLHFHDIAHLLDVLNRLRDHGNTVVVIEHNLDVIKTADWIIDLGPEGGAGGGTLVASGTPEEIARCKQSHTGRYLEQVLSPES